MSPLRCLCVMTTRQGFYWHDYTWTHSWKNSMLDRFVLLWKVCPKEWMALMMRPWNESSDRTTAVKSWRNESYPGSHTLFDHYLSRSFNMLWRSCPIRHALTLTIFPTMRY